MNKPTKLALAISCALSVSVLGTAWAQDASIGAELDSEVLQMDSDLVNHGEANVTHKIASDFADFAGDEGVDDTNAESLVSGLRNGSQILLDGRRLSRDADGNPVVDANGNPVLESYTHSFTPATGHLGYGNVFTSLALAQELLKQEGITDPTPEQIEAALNGDAEHYGILRLRSEGMGWGNIAKTLEVKKLGPVISSIKSGKQSVLAGDADTDDTAGDSVVEKPAKSNKDKDRAGKPEHAKLEHGSKPDHVDKPDKVEKIDRVERPEKVEKIDRVERPEKVERPDRPDKPDKPDKKG